MILKALHLVVTTFEWAGNLYGVTRSSHEKYGPVIQIERDMNGLCVTPFQAVQCACKERRIWAATGVKKVRILVDDKVMTAKQAEHWANEEYISLPKCEGCAKILNDDVHTHRLSKRFFCSTVCANRNYDEEVEKLKDEEEIDYL
jgi:hypothetical protein